MFQLIFRHVERPHTVTVRFTCERLDRAPIHIRQEIFSALDMLQGDESVIFESGSDKKRVAGSDTVWRVAVQEPPRSAPQKVTIVGVFVPERRQSTSDLCGFVVFRWRQTRRI
jgi:hypothetical protein